jgi:hypothetical protein
MITSAQCRAADGTPISDIFEHNRELAAEVAELKRRMREIVSVCQMPGFTAAARRNQILEIARRKL